MVISLWVDAVLRWSVNLNQLEAWDEVLTVYQKLIDHPRVGRGDKFEASVGIGIVPRLGRVRKRKKPWLTLSFLECTPVPVVLITWIISEAAFRLGKFRKSATLRWSYNRF